MNASHHHPVVAEGRALPDGLLAATVTPAGLSHAHLAFKSVTTTYVLGERNGNEVTVTLETAHNPASTPGSGLPYFDTLLHTVRIDVTAPRPGGTACSLFTVGVQALDHDVLIRSLPAGGALFAAPGDLSASRDPANEPDGYLVIERAGLRCAQADARVENVNGDRIWFVNVTGSHCEFTVETANQPRRGGSTVWLNGAVSGKSGHDNTPPRRPI